jgi:Fe2+ or Zn2+ uptake regulation protein
MSGGTHGDADAVLRNHGLQVTAQRLAVMRAVTELPHGTADDIGVAVRAQIGAISRQAVYDALATLTERGVLRRIQPAGSPARYEDRVGDNHHHLICRTCGRMVDVDCAVGDVPCLSPSDDAGFAIDEAEVTFWGQCPTCVGDPRGSPALDPPSAHPHPPASAHPHPPAHPRTPAHPHPPATATGEPT